jgi:polysaccharide pyruvyl transferase WcaK-like protein
MNVDVIGINLSNLILNGYGTNKRVLINAYIALIDNILLKSDSNVILLPHVMGGADLSALRIIQKNFLNNERVVLYDNEEISACELKFIISKCGYLVTARTHAAIAGYSSCVPTLAIGYSVKSFGIAKDIFGRSDNYVIHTKDVIHENDLVRRFEWIKSNEINIRDCLKKKMKGYIEKAENTIAALCKKR